MQEGIFKRIRTLNVSKTLLWLIGSNVVKSLVQWLLLIILIKFFSPEEVGFYTLGLAISAPIFMFADMQLKSILVVEPFRDTDPFPNYVFIRVFTTTLALLGLILYCVFFRNINYILILVILYKSTESLIDIVYGYLQKQDRMIFMSKSLIWRSLLGVGVFFLFVLLFKEMTIALLSLIVVMAGIFYIVDVRYLLRHFLFSEKVINKSVILSVLKKAFPLGISVLFNSYITNFPRIAIENNLGPEKLAYFGSYSYLVIGIFQIQVPIQTFLRQRLSVIFQQGKIAEFKLKVKKVVEIFAGLGGIVLVGYYLFGDVIIRILYKSSYLEYSYIVYYLVVAQILLSVSGILGIAILSYRVYNLQAYISFGVFLTVFSFSNFFIRQFGLSGAAYISLIAAFITLGGYSWIYMKVTNRTNEY